MNRIEGINMVGREAWSVLVSRHGGCELPIPTAIGTRRGEEMAALIGRDAAIKLIEYAGGDRLYISAGHDEILCARYGEIVAMHEQGNTPAQISRKWEGTLKYSERNVRMILAGRFEALSESISVAEQMTLPGL